LQVADVKVDTMESVSENRKKRQEVSDRESILHGSLVCTIPGNAW